MLSAIDLRPRTPRRSSARRAHGLAGDAADGEEPGASGGGAAAEDRRGRQVACGDTGVCALHVDEAGRLQGFALTGSETRRRMVLAKEVAA